MQFHNPLLFSTKFLCSLFAATQPACLFCVSGCMYDTLPQSGLIKVGGLNITFLNARTPHTLRTVHHEPESIVRQKTWAAFTTKPASLFFRLPQTRLSTLLECHWRRSKKSSVRTSVPVWFGFVCVCEPNGKTWTNIWFHQLGLIPITYKRSIGTSLNVTATWMEGRQKKCLAQTLPLHKTAGHLTTTTGLLKTCVKFCVL